MLKHVLAASATRKSPPARVRSSRGSGEAVNSRGPTSIGARPTTTRATTITPIADDNQAIRLDPKDAVAYNNRGNAYGDKGDYDRAMADYGDAIRLDPKYAYAYNGRGNAYLRKGDYDRAIADYDAAIRPRSQICLRL